MNRIMLTLVALSILGIGGSAQTSQRKPGDEQTRIGFFAGEWKFEGEAKPSPMGPGGKFTGTESCEWFPGGFHLVCQSEGTSPMGPMKGRAIMGYDPNEKTYTYYAISSLGEGFFVKGTVSGKVWSWNNENKIGDKLVKGRVTLTEQSPTSYTFKMEGSFDGGPWAVLEEAKATKAK